MSEIVILCYNKINLTLKCILATADAGYPISSITLIDNGSLPDFQLAIKKHYPSINIIRIQQNGGFAGGFTNGIKQYFQNNPHADSLLFLTNDTQPHPGCVEACEQTANETGAGLVAPCLMFRNDSERMDSIGAHFDRTTAALHHCKSTHLPTLLGSDEYIPGTAIWLKKDAFTTLGGTDESYVMYWEDVDFSFRAHEAGISQARCYNAKIQHSIGQTCHKKPIYTTFYYQRNRIWFCRKWLTREEWLHIRPAIEKELEAMEQKAAGNEDHNRLKYLSVIRSELRESQEFRS